MSNIRNPQAQRAASMIMHASNRRDSSSQSHLSNRYSSSRSNQQNNDQERKQLIKIVKFEVILLSYMFYNDDMKLSKEEIKQIKSFISLSIPKLNKEETKDLHSVIKLKPDFADIIRIKESYKFTNEGVNSLIDKIKGISDIAAYQDLLSRLQNYFQ